MEKNKIKYDYDEENDSLFIYSVNNYEYDFSLNASWDILIDFDKNGIPVAFEFLSASKTFDLEKKDFSGLNEIVITSKIRGNDIIIHIQLVVSVLDDFVNVGIDRTILNVSNLPNNDYDLELI